MATILDTFITKFGFETDDSGVDEAETRLSDFKANAIKIAAAVGGVLAGGFFLKAAAEAADETLKWADANGIVIETLGELEFATQRQGGSVEGLRGSLANMQRAIGEVERGTGRAKLAFEDYGLSVKNSNGQTKTADELLVDLNKKFATLSRAQQFDLATKMGIDQGTIRLLQTAPDEIERLRMEAADLGVLSRRDAESAAEFVDGLTNIGQAMQALKFEIGGLVFEPLSKFFKMIALGIAFFRKHKGVFLSIIGILGLVAAAYATMGIKAALAWLMALGPALLIPAAIGLIAAALVVLAEDFDAFFKGQDSAIGDLVEKWPALGDAIWFTREVILQLIQDAIEGFKIMGEALLPIRDAIFDFLIDPIGMVQTALKFLWNDAQILFSDFFDWIMQIGKAITDFLLAPINLLLKGLEKIPGFGTFLEKIGFGPESPGGAPLQESLPLGPSPSAQLAGAGGTNVNRSTELRTGDINVDARGGDSAEIAANVGTALSEQFKNAVEDFDSAIDK